MSPLSRRRPQDDEPGDAGALPLDLDTRVCPDCRTEVPAWRTHCPEHGTPTVPLEQLPPERDALLERFLRDEDEDVDGA